MLQAVLFIICVSLSENSEVKTNITLNNVNIFLNVSSKTVESNNNNNSSGIKSSVSSEATKLLQNFSLPIDENKTQESIKLTRVEASTESKKEEKQAHILLKIHATITRSKDAVWATIVLTFMCVLLVLAVAQSQMWKDYHGSDSQGVPLPNFNERVLFRDVMRHRMKSFKEMFKKKNKNSESELESLIAANEE